MVYIVENNHGSIYASIIYHLADSYVIYSIPWIYTLWLFNIAMEAMAHLQMVYLGLPINSMVDLSMANC